LKTINLFGIKISFNIKKSHSDEVDRYSPTSRLREKILYLIVCMFIISISSKIPLIYNNQNYRVGDKITGENILAPRTVTYRDDLKKEAIIENMIKDVRKEYIYSEDEKEKSISNFEMFFSEINTVKEKRLSQIDFTRWNTNEGNGYSISQNIVNELLSLSSMTLDYLEMTSKNFLNMAYDAGIYRERNDIFFGDSILEEELKKFPRIQQEVLWNFLSANYNYDENRTRASLNQNIFQISDQYTTIQAGDVIARTGDTLDEGDIVTLEALGISSLRKSVLYIIANIFYLLLVSSVFYIMCFSLFKEEILNKRKYKSIFLILAAFFLIYRFMGENYLYLIPVDTVLFLIILITKSKFSLAFVPAVLIFALPMTDGNLIYFMIYAVSIPLGYYLLWNVSTRTSIISAGVKLGIVRFILYILISIFNLRNAILDPSEMVQIILSGIASGTLTVAFLPYFEKTFNILTVFQLLELGDLSHPLLQKLSLEAPGTFSHSMMVATLAENAATAIGADPVFSRVASYYHDIGKTKRPKFFVENQEGSPNPHDEVTPTMSKLIITSHTKDGVEMGREYRIPQEIRNIMQEHHGTTFLAYFYNLAKSKDPNVEEAEYRYSGPKPRTKESAIIMLADSIEAAVRSISEKTPKNIENTIRSIISAKIDGNQLQDSPLTFNEIEMIIQSFLSSLIGIHHARLKYPGQNN